jgi:hypothetical protein
VAAFFQQSYVIDKRITPRFICYERADLWIGILLVTIGAVAMECGHDDRPAVMTASVDALPSDVKAMVIRKVATFADFSADNDPHGEHDFGKFVDTVTIYLIFLYNLYPCRKTRALCRKSDTAFGRGQARMIVLEVREQVTIAIICHRQRAMAEDRLYPLRRHP